ncbi:unnamed protein product [Pleuronectes platessa]|uniref:Uncharacterized protein n=1 Tax=Pleuronectes platessa TaxID=8262 RepID=A0A9N7VNL6_PLEPL|nr:unnamed protein product [Pleuronectes platessa]
MEEADLSDRVGALIWRRAERRLQFPACSLPDPACPSQSQAPSVAGRCVGHGASASSQLEVPRLHSGARILQRSEGETSGRKKRQLSHTAGTAGSFAHKSLRPQHAALCPLSFPSRSSITGEVY